MYLHVVSIKRRILARGTLVDRLHTTAEAIPLSLALRSVVQPGVHGSSAKTAVLAPQVELFTGSSLFVPQVVAKLLA